MCDTTNNHRNYGLKRVLARAARARQSDCLLLWAMLAKTVQKVDKQFS